MRRRGVIAALLLSRGQSERQASDEVPASVHDLVKFRRYVIDT